MLFWISAATRKLSVWFYNRQNKITHPWFIRPLLWNDLNNAILKDGILTIDFKNNKIIQQQIDELSASINEKEFNDFCKQQLATSNHETIKLKHSPYILYSDGKGNIFEDTSLFATGRSGWDAVPVPEEEWIELPDGG